VDECRPLTVGVLDTSTGKFRTVSMSAGLTGPEVGRCKLTVSQPVLEAPVVSASIYDMIIRFQTLSCVSTCAATPRQAIHGQANTCMAVQVARIEPRVANARGISA